MDNHPLSYVLYHRLLDDLSGQVRPGILPAEIGSTDSMLGGPLETPRDATEFAAQALAKAFLKKFEDEIVEGVPEKVALDKFISANQKCAEWTKPRFTTCGPPIPGIPDDALLYGEFRQTVDDVFGRARDVGQRWVENPNVSWLSWMPVFDRHLVMDWTRISHYAINGPGTAIGASDCSFLDKFDQSTITASRQFLIELFQSRVLRNPTWESAEKIRHDRFGYEVHGTNKLTFVPKTISEARCICIEPALNIFFQKGCEYLLLDVLKQAFNIDLANQQGFNAELARLGSITGDFATVDLSSASDTISREMCKDVLPKYVFRHLDVLRSPSCKLPDGSVVELKMMSSMGNATTFPLQTLLFACAVSTVYRLAGIPLLNGRDIDLSWSRVAEELCLRSETQRNFAVNGDDIIVHTEVIPALYRLLAVLGFSVNKDKSFHEGPFRESCGSDWYRGQGVRGVYCKTLRSQQDCYSLINRLVRWSTEHELVLRSTCEFLARRTRVILVPPDESDDSGIHAPLVAVEEKRAHKAFRPKDCLPFQRVHPYDFWRFIPNGLPFRELEERYTSDGIMLSISKGECTGGKLCRRSDKGYYQLVRGATPRWDRTRVKGGGFTSIEGAWIGAFRLNLGKALGLT
jgi:hypothetical protein